MIVKIKKFTLFVSIFLTLVGLFFGAAYGVDAYLKKFQASTNMPQKNDISPQDPVVIDFSKAVLFPDRMGEIKIEPKTEVKISWTDNKKRLVISPANFWKPETEYKIYYPGGTSVYLTKINAATFDFMTVGYPEVFGVYPQNGQKDILLDIEDPIAVDFDKSTRGFYMNFVLDPGVEVVYENNSDKTQFKLLPKEKLKEGQKYNFSVFAKYDQDSDLGYRKVYEGSFETLPPAPVNWEKDFTLRLAQAGKYTRARIKEGKYIDINLRQQILSTFENGKMVNSYIISSGKASMPTPKGNFQIYNKALRPWSKEYGLYMPYWMAFTSDGSRGIHELPEWPGGYKEGANHLGTPVSHGCVRLGVGAAKAVYDWADIGTPVVIY